MLYRKAPSTTTSVRPRNTASEPPLRSGTLATISGSRSPQGGVSVYQETELPPYTSDFHEWNKDIDKIDPSDASNVSKNEQLPPTYEISLQMR